MSVQTRFILSFMHL